ncbi:hypothetical protein LOY35_12345 [Pseudomonas sp. B21-028]|nr:hypothetical protein [Pseudomonas sp. B21-028]UVL86318.1 hypothetical protein LOY35_12345 [Pseudomonas sp. B21-028]
MTDFVNCQGLKVGPVLQRFVDYDVLPGTGLAPQAFWTGFAALVHELAPINRALLAIGRGRRCSNRAGALVALLY